MAGIYQDPDLDEVHVLSLHGRFKEFERLLLDDAKRATQAVTKDGETSLMLASLFGNVEVVQLLLTYGAVQSIKSKFECDALAYARESAFNTVRRECFHQLGFREKEGAILRRAAISSLLAIPIQSRPRPQNDVATGPIRLHITSLGATPLLSLGSMDISGSGIDPRLKTVAYIHRRGDATPSA